MTLDQRRRNSRKAQHLSEWRLQFEKEKLERWEKLQQRIASVNARRTARLAELQRRADEESRRVLGTSLANSGTLLLPAHDGAASADAAAAGGRAASSDKNTVGSAIVAPAQTAALKAPPVTSKSKAAVRKLAISGNLSGKRSGRSVISQPPPLPPTPTRTPTPGASPSGPQTNDTTENGDATGTAVAAAEGDEDAPAKPSKSKGKREKRKLKAQLIEMAEKADIAVIQAAIAMNNGASDDVAAAAGGGDAALDVEVASNKTATIPTAAENSSDADTYAHAQHLVRHCPGDCVSEGFAAWSKLAAKRVNVVARADHANDCEADARMSAVNPAVSSDPATEAIEELPAAEQLLVQKMRSTSAGDLLACVVNDLLAVAQKPPSEDAPVSMQVMQRLYVLLQHAALGAGGERPSPDPAVAVDVPVPGLSEVLLLRMLFGSEVGVLRSAAQLQTLLDALVFYQHQHVLRNTTTSSGTTAPTSATTTAPSSTAVASTPKSAGAVSAVSQELEVQAEVWKLLVDLLLQCSASAPGAALIVQSGLGAVLVDILQALLLTMEAYRKSDSSTTHAHSSLLASALDLPAVPVCAQFAFDGCFPTAVTSVASAVMTVLARVLSCVPAEGNGPSVGAVSCSQASLDSLAWYLFTMGQVQLLADNLRIRSQHWHYTQSYHYRAALPTQTITGSIDCVACSTDFYLAASDYLGSIGLFIRYYYYYFHLT